MSRKHNGTDEELMMGSVWEALEDTEKRFGVHLHYVIRRDTSSFRARRGYVVLFARRLGLGDEARTVLTEKLGFPTPDGRGLVAVLLQLVLWASNRLDEHERTAVAEQGDFFASPQNES